MANHLFETYKNSFMPHSDHMFNTASDMDMAKTCAYPSSKYALPHWKTFLGVVHNFHELIYQVQNHISTIQMLVQQYIFMYVLKCMLYRA